MIKFNNIIKELSSEYEKDYEDFTKQHYGGQYSADEYCQLQIPLASMIRVWIGHASNKKGMKIESFMLSHPDILDYMRDTLKKHNTSNTVKLMRGMSFNVIDEPFDEKQSDLFRKDVPWIKRMPEAYDMYKRKRGQVNLMSKNVKYSSWTTSASVRNRFSGTGAPKNIALHLEADIPIDDIIFCGELFEKTVDDITAYEYIIKHDKILRARFEVAYVGNGAKQMIEQEEERELNK